MATQRQNGFRGHVLIIGGGIGGNALALFLKKAGISSTVYEAYVYKDSVGGGLGLAPNGMNVLAELGLAQRVINAGTVALENNFYNARGKVLASIKNGDIGKYRQPAVSVLRPVLYDILTEEVKKQGIKIEYQKRLKNITQTHDKVIAHFEDGTQAEGDLLVGADGVRSQTRRVILPDSPAPKYVGIIGVGGVAPASAVTFMSEREKQSFNFTTGATGFFGYSGSGNGEVMWWSNLPSEKELTREQLADISLETVKQEMLAIYRDYHAPIEALISNSHSPVKHNVHDIESLPTWHNQRVVLIGDAAHAVSPNSGQGASLAMEDAMLLAKMLRDSSNYEQVFAQFEQERKPRVERIVAEGRRRSGDKAIVSPLQQKIRELMTTIFINLFGVKGQEADYGYKIAWE